MKVIVYTIAKNESSFVDRWVDSMKEADDIIVLDTGSTDDTVEKLKRRKVKVYEKTFDPWRFDVARNASLDLVPEDTDICVCTDLDEVLEPGWRSALEEVWQKTNPTRVKYLYHWKLNEKEEPVVSFYTDKIHTRKNYRWYHPVHEVLITDQPEKIEIAPIVLKHYPDNQKSRSSYLPLLEMSVKEDPEDDRNLHYLGREYMFYQKWEECIDTLHKHLRCKKATWKDERATSMRFIARSYAAKSYYEEAELWYQKAITEAPYLRECYVELASFYETMNRYDLAYPMLKEAEKIKEKSKSYINEEFAWNDAFYDLLSIASFYNGHYKEAEEAIKKAIEINPNVPRYQENLNLIIPYSLKASHE